MDAPGRNPHSRREHANSTQTRDMNSRGKKDNNAILTALAHSYFYKPMSTQNQFHLTRIPLCLLLLLVTYLWLPVDRHLFEFFFLNTYMTNSPLTQVFPSWRALRYLNSHSDFLSHSWLCSPSTGMHSRPWCLLNNKNPPINFYILLYITQTTPWPSIWTSSLTFATVPHLVNNSPVKLHGVLLWQMCYLTTGYSI